jgi:hypothetical protein
MAHQQRNHSHTLLLHKMIAPIFDTDTASQSLRARGATSLAENGVPPSIIQAIGQWVSDAFKYMSERTLYSFRPFFLVKPSAHNPHFFTLWNPDNCPFYLHLRQGPICDLGKGTSIIVNTCRIIKPMCIPKTLIIKISN